MTIQGIDILTNEIIGNYREQPVGNYCSGKINGNVETII